MVVMSGLVHYLLNLQLHIWTVGRKLLALFMLLLLGEKLLAALFTLLLLGEKLLALFMMLLLLLGEKLSSCCCCCKEESFQLSSCCYCGCQERSFWLSSHSCCCCCQERSFWLSSHSCCCCCQERSFQLSSYSCCCCCQERSFQLSSCCSSCYFCCCWICFREEQSCSYHTPYVTQQGSSARGLADYENQPFQVVTFHIWWYLIVQCYRFLQALLHALPSNSLLDTRWPKCSNLFQDVSKKLCLMHHKWRV